MDDDELGYDPDDWIADDHEDSGPEVPPPGDEDTVNRMLRWRASAVREVERVNRLADAEVARIEARRADMTAGARRRVEQFDRTLEGWARAAYLASGNEKRSWNFPNGRLALRKPQAKVEVVDQDAAVGWALAADRLDLLNTITLSKTKVKAEAQPAPGEERAEEIAHRLVIDGEIVPGVELVTRLEPTFDPIK